MTQGTNKVSIKAINYTLSILVVILTVIIIVLVLDRNAEPKTESTTGINSFQECADAGYAVSQSFPETCAVPGGKSFTNS